MLERVRVADIAQVYNLWNAYADAVNAGDMKRWIALWSNDGIQMPPDAPARYRKEQIQVEEQPKFDLFNSKMDLDPEEVCILGDHAYSHGSFFSIVTPKEGGTPIEIQGKFLTILEKQVDGSWKILIDCYNYNKPPEQDKQDGR